MIDPTTILTGTRIWRPVQISKPKDSKGRYTYKPLPVHLADAQRESHLCRATDQDVNSFGGVLIATDSSQAGLCIFINGNIPSGWTHLAVVKSLKSALVTTAQVGTIHDLYNVFCDPNRRTRIDKLASPDPDLVPRHTENYIFKGDRVLVPKGLTGEGKREDSEFIHKQEDGFTAVVTEVCGPKSVFVLWYSDGIEFSAPVAPNILTVIRS